MAPKIAIVYYSMYGHIKTMAEAEKRGIEKAGGTADLYQIPETLPQDVLTKMGAPPKPTEIAVLEDPATLEQYDGFLFGIPTRYGNFPGQWKAFWDKTGKQWGAGGFHGKYAGLFVSSGSMGGGQESTAIAAMSTLAHHGIIYVPFGYAKAFPLMTDLTEIHGGSPWGAGTFAGADGSRQPSARELEIAEIQAEVFYQTVAKATAVWLAERFAKYQGGAVKKAAEAAAAGAKKDEVGTAGKEAEAPTVEKQENTKSGEPAKKTEAPRLKQEKKPLGSGEGPCGLPAKCTIL